MFSILEPSQYTSLPQGEVSWGDTDTETEEETSDEEEEIRLVFRPVQSNPM